VLTVPASCPAHLAGYGVYDACCSIEEHHSCLQMSSSANSANFMSCASACL